MPLDPKNVQAEKARVVCVTLHTKDSDFKYGELHELAARFIKETGVRMISMTQDYDPESGTSYIIIVVGLGYDPNFQYKMEHTIDQWLRENIGSGE